MLFCCCFYPPCSGLKLIHHTKVAKLLQSWRIKCAFFLKKSFWWDFLRGAHPFARGSDNALVAMSVRLPLKRAAGGMGSIGSDRGHGEGLRGQRTTDLYLLTRTHRTHQTPPDPTRPHRTHRTHKTYAPSNPSSRQRGAKFAKKLPAAYII